MCAVSARRDLRCRLAECSPMLAVKGEACGALYKARFNRQAGTLVLTFEVQVSSALWVHKLRFRKPGPVAVQQARAHARARPPACQACAAGDRDRATRSPPFLERAVRGRGTRSEALPSRRTGSLSAYDRAMWNAMVHGMAVSLRSTCRLPCPAVATREV